MREVDRLAVEEFGITLLQMMELAGYNLAELASRLVGTLEGKGIVVLAGRGNNGGGGLSAARHLANRGAHVQIIVANGAKPMGDAAAHQRASLDAMGIRTGAYNGGSLHAADLYLDCLVGYSLAGALRGDAADIVRALPVTGTPVLSLDLPSGLDPDNGVVEAAAVVASATMTLALPKRGLFAQGASRYVGDLYLADIGLPATIYHRIGLDVASPFVNGTIVSLSDASL